MSKLKKASLLLLLLSVPLSWAAEIPIVPPAKAQLSEAKLGAVETFTQGQVQQEKLAGAIVMESHRGKIGFFHTYGSMEREAQKPVKRDTIFHINSMSKSITTAAALNLYDAGKIGLDDPVSKFIPVFAHLSVAAPNCLRPSARRPRN